MTIYVIVLHKHTLEFHGGTKLHTTAINCAEYRVKTGWRLVEWVRESREGTTTNQRESSQRESTRRFLATYGCCIKHHLFSFLRYSALSEIARLSFLRLDVSSLKPEWIYVWDEFCTGSLRKDGNVKSVELLLEFTVLSYLLIILFTGVRILRYLLFDLQALTRQSDFRIFLIVRCIYGRPHSPFSS